MYDTPHGVACAMMLPIVMEYNAGAPGNPKPATVENFKALFRKIM